jgi:NitT/TauT family transport system permease protein
MSGQVQERVILIDREVPAAVKREVDGRESARAAPFLLGSLGIAGLFVLWFIGTDVLVPATSFVRRFSPIATMASFGALISGTDLLVHISVSLKRVLAGLACAIVIGVPLGLAVGSYRPLDTATSPVFQLLRMISPLSWMPVAIMLFGLGDNAIVFLLAFAATWPILLNTAAGVRALDERWLLLARSLAATPRETLIHIVLPGVMDHVLTGIRLAIGISWIVLVPCEMLGVSSGLGYLILDTRDRLAYSELMAVVLVIGIIGFVLDGAARGLHWLWRRA